MKFGNSGTLQWATYYGGSGEDRGYSIDCDIFGNAFVTGCTTSSVDFPTKNSGTFFQSTFGGGTSDAFVLKFDSSGNSLWATYYGGNGNENYDVPNYDYLAVDHCANVYVSFETGSANISTLAGCDAGYIDNSYNGAENDEFIALFSNAGVLRWATYLGGNGRDWRAALAIDDRGNLLVAGELSNFGGWLINNSTYPLKNSSGGAYYDGTFNGGANDDDGIILKFSPVALVQNSSITDATCNGVCDGSIGLTTVSGGCTPYRYLWSNGLTTKAASKLCVGTYSVAITDNIFCRTLSLNNLDVSQIGMVTAEISGNITICAGQSTTLSASGGGTYQWNEGSVTSVIFINPTTTTSYSVIVSNGSCSDTASVTISVFTLQALAEKDTVICEGASVLLKVSGGTNYWWSTGEPTANITVSPSITTLYTVTVTNGPCKIAANLTVTVNPVPTVAISGNTTIKTGNSVILSASGGGKYLWSPSSGLSCNTCANPMANPQVTTIYCVEVTNANGCTDDSCLTVTIEIICADIFVPTAFSPNGDGENEELYIKDDCIQTLEFIIFNRWGEKVFETNDIEKGWDGIFKRKKLDTGVFTYFLHATLMDGTQITKKGNVSLIR